MTRRLAGVLTKRVAEAKFDTVTDERNSRGKYWKLSSVLAATVVGMAAGARSCAELEELTDELDAPMRKCLGISRRLPDTTTRTILCGLAPEALKRCLHNIIRAAARRKSLEPEGLPFGVVSLDGKASAVAVCDSWYAQSQSSTSTAGLVRTITATLTSSKARPIVDVTPVPAHTNEMGAFDDAFHSLIQVCPRRDFFRLVTYDAGATSLANANLVREHGVHYLFGLKASQPSLLHEARRLLADRTTHDAMTEDADGTTRRLFVASLDGWGDWGHLRTLIRVTSCVPGKPEETRYFISSLPRCRLGDEQWLLVVRRHWGVETSHQILDLKRAFEEDQRPWISACPRGTVVVMVLRRIAYTILTLFRSVTQRSHERRLVPWRKLMRSIELALLRATSHDLSGLRFAATAPS